MKFMAEAKGLSLATYVAPELPAMLLGDEKRLKQILTNLISNAIKFTETGGVEARLECAGAEHWIMRVSDTGPGIPTEAQTRIFESFWQVDNSLTRKQQGYGLGLSIVKQLTELMGGRIVLDSQAGRGSTFDIVLPLKAQIEDETRVSGQLKDEPELDTRRESL
jgi:signal transduction histidine kinase